MDKATLINRALRFIGERPITNPEAPETEAGKHMAGIYDQCRREVLRIHPWNFAETWEEVDRTTAPNFGYSDAYVLPENFIRLLVVGDMDMDTLDFRLLNQGAPEYRRVIALDNSGALKLQISFTADIENLAMWDPLAIKVLALWMAVDSVKGITGKSKDTEILNEMLAEALKDAGGVDGQEQTLRRHVDSHVQRERDAAQFGGGYFTNVQGFY